MAITTTLTLKSDAGDLLTDELSVVTSKDLHKAGTTTDLNQVRMGRNDVPTGTSFDLLDATTLAINKANKVYISNRSTDETYYIIGEVNSERMDTEDFLNGTNIAEKFKEFKDIVAFTLNVYIYDPLQPDVDDISQSGPF